MLILKLGGGARAAPSLRSIRSQYRFKSTATVIPPCQDCRQLALPIAFLSVKGWGKDQDPEVWKEWTGHFSKAGYTSMLLEVDPSDIPKEASKTSQGVLKHLDTELTSLLANGPSPFPPLLISTHLSTLLAETFVSSHPLSGLLLRHPISVPKVSSSNHLPTPLNEFTYEPKFPIAVMGEGESEWWKVRLLEEFGEYEDGEEGEVAAIEGGLNKKGWRKVIRWMEENGL